MSALYLAQGLPGGLIAHALPVFLREAGVSLSVIGAIKLLALPWLLKVIWAPFVDKKGTLSSRFKWIVSMQLCSALGLFSLSFVMVNQTGFLLSLSLAILLAINCFSATQDIATDGAAASLSSETELGLINSVQVAGYKVGMLIGGSGLLALSTVLALPELTRILSILLVLLLWPLISFRRSHVSLFNEDNSSNTISFGQDDMNGASFINVLKETYKGFLGQRFIGYWLLVLLTYKLSDSLGSAMLKPMLVDLGVEKLFIGELTFISSLIGLCGALVAGVVYKTLGALVSLTLFCVLQGVSVTSFYFLSIVPVSEVLIYVLVGIEQFCDGLSTVALFAIMMSHCRAAHEGADYTLQASLQLLLAGVLGAFSGIVADLAGYSVLYSACGILSIISLLFVLQYCRNQIKQATEVK